jgi:thiol-disulfide isomerase/thioredoxin
LQALLARLKKDQADRDLQAFVHYRWLEATYSLSLQEADADYEKIQQQWLRDLGDFVKSYPASPDAAEAMIQLALADEFAGKDDEAKKWYQRVTKEFPASERAKKAAGSIRRIDSVGKSISLRGTDLAGNDFDLAKYRGKVVVVQYWATWCNACTRDMALLSDLVKKYGQQGFAVVGVNLDADRSKAVQFLQQKRLPWVQLHEAGGLGSRYATEMGVLSLPVTLLIDSQGKVVNRGIQVSQAEEELKKVLR